MRSWKLELFEFNECSWVPSVLREMSTDFLSSLWCFDGFGTTKPAITPVLTLMEKSIEHTKKPTLVDLASGSGEASTKLYFHLKQKGYENAKIVLTDLYPNIEKFKQLSKKDENIAYEENSVDAMKCNIDGFRTFFASFHHFNYKQAVEILKDTVNKLEGIGIFEMTYGGLWNLFLLIGLAPLWVLLLTPVIKPFKFTRILFTYIIPIIPLMLWWDGFVSVLRTYTKKELMHLIKLVDPNNTYEWHSIKKICGLPMVFAMVGYPKKETIAINYKYVMEEIRKKRDEKKENVTNNQKSVLS